MESQRHDQFSRMRAQSSVIEQFALTHSSALWTAHPLPGKWSASENLAHLVRYQEIFSARVERIATEDDPRFDAYRSDEEPEFAAICRLSIAQQLEKLLHTRAMIEMRLRALDEEDWQRTATHSRYGSMTQREWFEFFLLHEAHHLLVIFQRLHGG